MDRERQKIRPYQLKLLEESKKSNIIAFLETGTGKTLISIRLIEDILNDNQKKAIFLAPSNALVHQQAQQISKNLELKVADFSFQGFTSIKYSFETWKQEYDDYSVYVMTPQVLLYCLQHGFLDLSIDICLLIFDECHHATKQSPYARLMKGYYHSIPSDCAKPKIMGMTASPILRGRVQKHSIDSSLQELELILNSRLVTASVDGDLNGFITSAKGKMLLMRRNFDPIYNNRCDQTIENNVVLR
jgi:endoribonuclease Dicer